VKPLLAFLLMGLAYGAWAQSDAGDVELQNHLRRAREAAASNKYGDAFKELKEANRVKNNHCDVCFLQAALLYSKVGDRQHMLESAQKALEAASNDAIRAQAHALQGEALVGLSASDARKMQAAEQQFRTAIQLDPQTPLYRLNLGIILLKESHDEEGVQELNNYLAQAPEGPFAETAKKMIANPRRARQNYAPEFHFTTLQGENISSEQLAGKIVVLDFWATWCPPCRASVPDLKDLEKKYSRDQLTLISISADEDETKWRDFCCQAKDGLAPVLGPRW